MIIFVHYWSQSKLQVPVLATIFLTIFFIKWIVSHIDGTSVWFNCISCHAQFQPTGTLYIFRNKLLPFPSETLLAKSLKSCENLPSLPNKSGTLSRTWPRRRRPPPPRGRCTELRRPLSPSTSPRKLSTVAWAAVPAAPPHRPTAMARSPRPGTGTGVTEVPVISEVNINKSVCCVHL